MGFKSFYLFLTLPTSDFIASTRCERCSFLMSASHGEWTLSVRWKHHAMPTGCWSATTRQATHTRGMIESIGSQKLIMWGTQGATLLFSHLETTRSCQITLCSNVWIMSVNSSQVHWEDMKSAFSSKTRWHRGSWRMAAHGRAWRWQRPWWFIPWAGRHFTLMLRRWLSAFETEEKRRELWRVTRANLLKNKHNFWAELAEV